MDTLTHALLGAACALAVPARRTASAGPPAGVAWPLGQRVALTAFAAAWPDIDFALFPLDPLRFLADWHQGPTHAPLMAPLWAALIALGACGLRATLRSRARPGRAAGPWARGWLEAWAWALLGLLSHALADAVTAYGLAWAWPLAPDRAGLGITWVVDPLWTLPLAAGVGWALRRSAPRRSHTSAHVVRPAWAALGVVVALGLTQAGLQQRALQVAQAEAQRRGLPAGAATALAQPLSPLHWQLILADGNRRHVATLTLPGPRPLSSVLGVMPAWPGLAALQRLAAGYVPAERLQWQTRGLDVLPGDAAATPLDAATIHDLWASEALAAYRRFARHPALSRIDLDAGPTGPACVWFTDLRYDLPGWPETFRVGACRAAADAPWVPYRLRYLRADARQRL